MTTSKELKIEIGSSSIKLIGDLNINTVKLFKETIMDKILENRKLTFDLLELDFMDSSGIGSLVKLSREVTYKITLTNLKPNIKNTISMMGCAEFFDIKD